MATPEELTKAATEMSALLDDRKIARAKGMHIIGFPRQCPCGGRAYGSPKAHWQNRVVCLSCGRQWSH